MRFAASRRARGFQPVDGDIRLAVVPGFSSRVAGAEWRCTGQETAAAGVLTGTSSPILSTEISLADFQILSIKKVQIAPTTSTTEFGVSTVKNRLYVPRSGQLSNTRFDRLQGDDPIV